jgi:ABC-2 type transport system ATP-binding protein
MDLPDHAIEATGLVKTYAATKTTPEKTALNGIDLKIPRGSIFGLLGPNGAGKSTFINILAGLTRKTGGTVKIWGRDIDERPRDARAAIGVVPQELAADVFFTPRESLETQAGMYGVPKKERRTDELLAALGLTDKADAYVRQLSGGMKRRLMVAKAMVHNPPVLILDEPTAGVDVELRRQLWNYVVGLNRLGVTIVLTTHYLEEAQELCDQIAIVNRGEVVACEPTSHPAAAAGHPQCGGHAGGAGGHGAGPDGLRGEAAQRRLVLGDLQDRPVERRTGAGGGAGQRPAHQGHRHRGPRPGGRLPGPDLRRRRRQRPDEGLRRGARSRAFRPASPDADTP